MKKSTKKGCLLVLSIFLLFFSAKTTSADETGLPTFGKLAGKSVAIYKNDDGSISSVKDPTTLKDITNLYKFYTDSVTSASAVGKANTTVGDTKNTSAVVSMDSAKTTFKTQDGQTIKFTTTDDGQYGIVITGKNGVDTTYNSEFRNTTKTTELLNPQQYDDAWVDKQNTRINEQNAQAIRDTLSAGASGDITKLPLLAGGNTQATITKTSDSGPSYINDGTKICDTNGCKYTLMAPIGSLLGDASGVYEIKKTDAQKGLCPLLNSWFRIGIALAGMLAVVMIVLGGFQYATTDSLFDKEEGKGKIQNALWGLLLALTTWLVVSTINPALADCTINANAVQLSQQSTSVISTSGYGVLSASNSSGGTGGTGGGSSGMDTSDATYNKKLDQILTQWTEQDDKDAEENNAGALAKWEGIQMQIDELNNSYSSSNSGSKTSYSSAGGSSGSANQKILARIEAGGNKCTAVHCFAGAKDLADEAGITYNMSYQSSSYKAGSASFSDRGTARLPTAGEQVDYLFYKDGRAYPNHTVIVKSIDSNGNAIVWDWKNGKAEGYRKVTFSLNSPGTYGNIGRIYVPSNK